MMMILLLKIYPTVSKQQDSIFQYEYFLSSWPRLDSVLLCLRATGGLRVCLQCFEGVPGLHHRLPRQLCGHLDVVARPGLQAVKPGAVFG